MPVAAILAHLVQLGIVGLEAYTLIAEHNAGEITDEELARRWTAMQSRLRAASDAIQAP